MDQTNCPHADSLVVGDGQSFGRDFPEDQYHEGYDSCGNTQ
jgi:hypothetical protein